MSFRIWKAILFAFMVEFLLAAAPVSSFAAQAFSGFIRFK